MKCDKCGKEMTYERGIDVIGAKIGLFSDHQNDIDEFLKKQLGKYAWALNQHLHFCWECMLDVYLAD